MHLHQEAPQLPERVKHGGVERGEARNVLLRGGTDLLQVVGKAKAVDDPLTVGLEHGVVKPFERSASEILLTVQDELEDTGQGHLDRRAAELGIALRRMRVADREQRAVNGDGVVHRRSLPNSPIVDIAAGVARRDRANEILLPGATPIVPKCMRAGMRMSSRTEVRLTTVLWSTMTPG